MTSTFLQPSDGIDQYGLFLPACCNLVMKCNLEELKILYSHRTLIPADIQSQKEDVTK